MVNKDSKVIYVGKAKNLKNRVTSYFLGNKDPKTQQMLSFVDDLHITITRTELEAFLLESQLIRELKPKYNIIFKDDKSYPYLQLTTQEDFPRLTFYRGMPQQNEGDFFGPYPSSRSVRESLELLQKIFNIRQCDNAYFKGRTRPCLQYQIKRCSAPCVGNISKDKYLADVSNVKLFLRGKSQEIIQSLIVKMEQAAIAKDYEQAAKLRDQIVTLRVIQKQQVIIDSNVIQNIDVLGVAYIGDHACIHLLSIRNGHMLGSKQYFPASNINIKTNKAAILESFIQQHYSSQPAGYVFPTEILTRHKLSQADILSNALSKYSERVIKFTCNVKNERSKWLEMAEVSAKESLDIRIAKKSKISFQLQELSKKLGIDMPKRIECFDVSHTQGDSTVASCVVFDVNGALKSDYRRFNIKTVSNGDDYAALQEALERHLARVQRLEAEKPDILLVDGGKGQLARAETVIKGLQLHGVVLIAIAKGVDRKPGLETLYLSSQGDKLELSAADSTVLQLILQIRDEAHRFAITGHRNQRKKRQIHSILDDIPGVGNNRRRELLRQFGGLQEIRKASVEELAMINGISEVLARRIYDALH